MAAALLAVRIKVTNFYGRAITFLPLNWHIDIVHIYLPSQRGAQRHGFFESAEVLMKYIFSHSLRFCASFPFSQHPVLYAVRRMIVLRFMCRVTKDSGYAGMKGPSRL